MDADGALTVTGGTLIYGGTATGNNFAGGSTQSYVFLDTPVPANAAITVRSGGTTLITFTPPMECRYLVLSSPDLVSGRSYEVYSGTTRIAAPVAGTGGGMGFGGMGGGRGGGGGARR
jgi:hypothetical protein